MTKTEWRRCYRAARLLPHRFACQHALNSLKGDGLLAAAFDLALRLRLSHEWRGGVECAKIAAANGWSFRNAIKLHLGAVRGRRSRRYDPLHNPMYRAAA